MYMSNYFKDAALSLHLSLFFTSFPLTKAGRALPPAHNKEINQSVRARNKKRASVKTVVIAGPVIS